jgi:hypothetical protein
MACFLTCLEIKITLNEMLHFLGIACQDYWSRKQFFSINVQILGNETKKICNIVARWAGSTHDARVWNNCNAKVWMDQHPEYMIAGSH